MANIKLSLIRRCKTPVGWRRYPVAMSANGRVKADTVQVAGGEVTYPTGYYEVRSYEGSTALYDRVDGNGSEALIALKAAQRRSNVVSLAAEAGVELSPVSTRVVLRERYPKFIQAAHDRGSIEAADVYSLALEEFLSACQKTYADELVREDVTRFHKTHRARGMSARTVHNRHMSVRAILLSMGLDAKAIAGRAPKFEKTMSAIYEPSDLTSFFSSLTTTYEVLFFDLLLQTGLREREAMHLEWRDISWARHTLKVESKPAWDHKIKDAEERELPLSESLLSQLRAFRLVHPDVHLGLSAIAFLSISYSPRFRQFLRLLKHRLRGGILSVRRILPPL